MEKLTEKQLEALSFIQIRTKESGTPPTLRELCEYMGYKAVGSAQDVIAALRRKGFLQLPNKQTARCLLLTNQGYDYLGVKSTVASFDVFDDSYTVACLGAVPAGNPLEALENAIGNIKVSSLLLPNPKPHPSQLFGLRAQGDSMIDAGIHDGDWLVIKAAQEAEPGAIVIARLEGEATVKRLMKEKQKGWYLKPENPRFQNIFAEDEPFEIVGRVVALQRMLS